MERVALEVRAHVVVEALLLIGRREVLGDRDASSVTNVLGDLPPQRPLAERGQATLEIVELDFGEGSPEIGGPEDRDVAEQVLVEDTDQAEQLEQGVLEWRGRQQDLRPRHDRVLDGAGDFVARLVHVAQPVRLVDDHEIPGDGADGISPGAREMVRAHDDRDRVVEGVRRTGPLSGAKRPGVEDDRGDEELLLQFLNPPVPQGRRDDGEDPPPALGPELADDEARLDSLAEPDLVGQERAAGQGRAERKECSVDLMRIQIYRRVQERRSELLQAVGRATASQQVCEILGVIVGGQGAPSWPCRTPSLIRADNTKVNHALSTEFRRT